MPINPGEWDSITELIERLVKKVAGRRSDYFLLARVKKRDKDKNLIWVEELGDQPIPLIAFDYEVKYYLAVGSTTQMKKAKVKVICPKIGQQVFIAREWGTDRMPRCLGVIMSKDFILEKEGSTIGLGF